MQGSNETGPIGVLILILVQFSLQQFVKITSKCSDQFVSPTALLPGKKISSHISLDIPVSPDFELVICPGTSPLWGAQQKLLTFRLSSLFFFFFNCKDKCSNFQARYMLDLKLEISLNSISNYKSIVCLREEISRREKNSHNLLTNYVGGQSFTTSLIPSRNYLPASVYIELPVYVSGPFPNGPLLTGRLWLWWWLEGKSDLWARKALYFCWHNVKYTDIWKESKY